MGMPPNAEKHKLDGMGGASAATILAVLAANPATTFLTVGIPGKILYFLLSKTFTWLASMGLVMLNLGAEKVLGAIEKSGYDGSMESALKLVDSIRTTGRELTPEEIKEIDDKVIAAFMKFGKMTRRRG